MIPISKLKVVQPHDVPSGTLLVRNARYDRAPMLVLGSGNDGHLLRFDTSEKAGFNLMKMAVNLGPHLAVDEFQIQVDMDFLISPTRSDIPFGAMCLTGDQQLIKVKVNHATAFATVNGELVNEPSFDDFAAFAKWQIVTRVREDFICLYEQDLPLTTEEA